MKKYFLIAIFSFLIAPLSWASLGDGNTSYYQMEGNSNDAVTTYNGTDTNITYGSGYGKNSQGGHYGGTSKIVLPSGALPVGGSARSISAWVKTSSSAIETWLSYGSTGGTGQAVLLHLNVNGAGDIYFGGQGNDAYTATGLFTTNTWHHLVYTYAGGAMSSSTFKIYLDGVQKTLTIPGTSAWNTSNTNIELGHDLPYNSRFFSGDIDEVAFYNRVLTSDEVISLYASSTGLFYPFPADVSTSTVSTSSVVSSNYNQVGFSALATCSSSTASACLVWNLDSAFTFNFFDVLTLFLIFSLPFIIYIFYRYLKRI